MESNSFCNHISVLRGSPICQITSIIADRIGRLKVLLPINHSYNKICDILIRRLKIKTQEIPIVLCPAVKKKSYLSVARWRVLSNYLGITRTVLSHCQLIANQI